MPAMNTYESALLTSNILNDAEGSASGAVYDARGDIVEDSVRSVDRTDSHQTSDPDTIHRPSAVIGTHNHDGYDMYVDEAIFGGHIFAGWGHTITETISTAWAASEVSPEAPLVMVPWGRMWVTALPRIREAMSLAGWGARPLIMASGSAVFGKLHVPQRLVQFDQLLYEDAVIPATMNATYDLMIDRSLRSGEHPKMPTFLARSRGHRREHPHEVGVERVLAQNGFRIVEGWDMSVQEQISLINSSSSLVAFSGSSLHNSVFADRRIPVLEIMDSRASSSSHKERPLQAALCQLREQSFTRIPGYENGQERDMLDIVDAVIDLGIPVA